MESKFTIKAVAERTGVSVHTLRAWERRYGVPSPHRGADNRYRLYDEQDIADVLFLKQQVGSGVAPSQASLLLRQQHNYRTPDVLPTAAQPVESMRAALFDAFAQSDERTARQLLDQCFALFTPEQVALQIIQPTMVDIGEQWMGSRMTVWQEHLASNVIEQKLFAILQAQPAPPVNAPLLAAACAPSEEHELGLAILALLARRRGWRVIYLGRETPLDDLIDLARASKPNVIAVSITTPLGLAGVIPWLKEENHPGAPLIFGGRMPNLLPSLRARLPGGYVGHDAMQAVNNLMSAPVRADTWAPPKRALNAAERLVALRLRVAGDAVGELAALAPMPYPTWDAVQLSAATVFLIDSLACALAFDVPELMDLQRHWLAAAMPARSVPPQLIDHYLDIVNRVLQKQLTKEHAQPFVPLLERLKLPTGTTEAIQ